LLPPTASSTPAMSMPERRPWAHNPAWPGAPDRSSGASAGATRLPTSVLAQPLGHRDPARQCPNGTATAQAVAALTSWPCPLDRASNVFTTLLSG
jgi:hypothetical protein